MSDRVERLFDDLRDALAVEPSMGFAPGVRARIAERAARRRRGRTTAAVGLALVAGMAAVFTGLPWRAAEIPAPDAFAVRVVTAPTAMSPAIATRAAPAVTEPKRRTTATARHQAMTPPAAPIVLVPDDQAIALDLLLRGRALTSTSVLAETATWPVVEALPDIDPIEIPPLPGTPADPNERKPR